VSGTARALDHGALENVPEDLREGVPSLFGVP